MLRAINELRKKCLWLITNLRQNRKTIRLRQYIKRLSSPIAEGQKNQIRLTYFTVLFLVSFPIRILEELIPDGMNLLYGTKGPKRYKE